MTSKQFDDLLVAHKAERAQLHATTEKIEIIEAYLAKTGVSFKDSDAKRVYRARTFGQFGEDSWIRKHITLPKKGFFIDVGAADGITNSNTYWLEKIGWEGVCFEPDPRNFLSCNLYRDNVIQMAVSDKNGKADFAQAAMSPDWSGLNIPVDALQTIKVKVTSLNSYLEENNIQKVDYLSVDVEGTELKVMKGFDLEKYKPAVVILEFLSPTDNSFDALSSYMRQHGYKIAHKTFSNLICVPKKRIRSGS